MDLVFLFTFIMIKTYRFKISTLSALISAANAAD